MYCRTLLRRMLTLRSTPTPNPNCYAFSIPSSHFENFVPDGQTCEVAHRGMAWVHPITAGLFDQYPEEIRSVFLAPRQLSVTVFAQVDWEAVGWSIGSFLGHYLVLNGTCVAPDKAYALMEDDLHVRADDSEVVQCLKELLRDQVRPMVQRDGGDVRLLGFDETTGVVSLAMLGACRNCPSSQNTLKQGIERVIKYFLPEVSDVVEAKDSKFYKDFGLAFDSEAALFREAARLDTERRRHMRVHLTPSLLSYDALSEPDGE